MTFDELLRLEAELRKKILGVSSALTRTQRLIQRDMGARIIGTGFSYSHYKPRKETANHLDSPVGVLGWLTVLECGVVVTASSAEPTREFPIFVSPVNQI